jgi:general secretion pathway protein A
MHPVYEAYYGFREKPFNLTPDPKYLFLSQRHGEAFAHLEFGRRERGGFAVITGEVGTGKTTLARFFLSRLGPRTATAVVLYPALSAAELLRSILDDLHVAAAGSSLKDLVDALHHYLLEARAQGREVVLLIDEAQDLSPEVLEQIRLISNLETDTEKLIQIVLMGQTELGELLARRELRQIAQRVSARYHLGPLDRAETEQYVRHRLRVAEGEGKVAFTAGALGTVHRLSGGVPRLINLICDRSLLAGYVRGTRSIEASLVKQAAREVAGRPDRRVPAWSYAALAVALIALAVAVLLGLPAPAPAPTAAKPEAAAAPQAAPAAEALESLLLALPREASLQASVDAVQALWGAQPLERTGFRTHLDQLRALDLPVVLEMFHPARHDTCHLALLRVEGDLAVVAGGALPLRVGLAALDRFWTRQALFLWRDSDAVARASAPEREAWAATQLTSLGYGGVETGAARAVARFQRAQGLAADGVVGSRTLVALYSRLGAPRPRLSGGGAS